MTIQQYKINEYFNIAKFVNDVTYKQQTTLPESCNNVKVSLGRLLRSEYINQANKDIKAYIAAIDQDILRKVLITDLENISQGLDEFKLDGAYPESVPSFQPWKDATDKLIRDLNLSTLPVNLLDDLISMQKELDIKALAYEAYLGEGFQQFGESVDKAEVSFNAFNNACSIPETSVKVLSDLQANLVKDLKDVHNSGNIILTMIGEWAKGTRDAININKLLALVNNFPQDVDTNSLPVNFSIDLKNLGDALTFGQSFVESKFATLDLSHLIGVCVSDIILSYND